MKIAINGEIIDTENIYKISKIHQQHIGEYTTYKGRVVYFDFERTHSFNILLYNNKVIRIDSPITHPKDIKGKKGEYDSYCLLEQVEGDVEKTQTAIDESFNKLNEFRDSIIAIWSDNPSKIPQFNI